MIKNMNLLVAISCVLNLCLIAPSLADDEPKDNSRNCIQTRTLKGTAVVDDDNVLFIKKGNSVYHNPLPQTCKGLSQYKQFDYVTTSGSLCSQDLIYIIDGQGRRNRACRLGPFLTIDGNELKALVENSQKAAAAAASEDESADEDEPES